MGFDHRKLLQTQINSSAKTLFCVKPCTLKDGGSMVVPCSQNCSAIKSYNDNPPTRPLPLPLPPPPLIPRTPDGDKTYQKQLMTTSMTIMGLMIGVALIFGLLMAIIRVYLFKKNNSRRRRRRSPPILFVTQEDFVDEEHGPEIDHPIWYIHTIGLQQSIIDSITIFKYKKDEGLIEGTECSVCLSEFEEDESLRLLPKCSHAFHISCIDTWLRSHKNCPLCRAPIVNDAIVAQAVASEANSNDSGSREETHVENSENASELRSNNVEEGGTSEVRIGDDNFGADNSKSVIHSKVRNSDSDSRVLSDLADNRRVVDEDVQPMRRSVSFDSSSASMIYQAVANVNLDKSKGSSHTELVQLKNSRSKNVAKRGSGNLSISKLMKCSSIGRSLQKGPLSMKRSFSSSGKFLSSRNCKSQDSFLPL